jgi:hypothetical protein
LARRGNISRFWILECGFWILKEIGKLIAPKGHNKIARGNAPGKGKPSLLKPCKSEIRYEYSIFNKEVPSPKVVQDDWQNHIN